MTEFSVGHSTRYPTISGIPIVVHVGGSMADGSQPEQPTFSRDDKPQIHMNASAIHELKDQIVWKEYHPS